MIGLSVQPIIDALRHLPPCPQCGAHRWFQNGDLLARDIVCCQECNAHCERRTLEEPAP